METKNLTKSFGIRVPLDMYLKMIEVGAENKISITDICLYSLANSGILKSNFNFKIGGEVNTNHIAEIKRLNEILLKSEKSRNTFRVCMEESDEEVKRLKQEIQKLTDAKNTYHEAFSEGQEETKKLRETIEELKLRMKGMVRTPISQVEEYKKFNKQQKEEEERFRTRNHRKI
jgi:hypothetical protein